MTLRAGRRAVQIGFVAMLGIGAAALPAAAQSYLADSSGNGSVTVDYSVLGQGGMPAPGMARSNLPMGALPSGGCNCPGAPLGVISSAPQPTFSNPFGNARVAQAPAVPPGFMPFSQMAASGGGETGGTTGSERVVLTPPAAASQSAGGEMAPMAPAEEAASTAALPMTTPTANGTGSAMAPAETPQMATPPATTPTQNEAAAATGPANPPPGPETMPTTVPSPVEQPAAAAPATTTPATPAPAAETPAAPATQAPAAATTAPAATGGEQQAAVTPATPPAAAAPAPGTLPEGASRILYTTESDDVPASATAELDKIGQAMQANQNMRVQVLAYASGTADNESKARRKSLARGLAIRSYLINKAGVPSIRIDVRALGTKADGGPADRVDLIPTS